MKKKIWYTADTHFGHKNIIKYCKRPFESVDEMNAAMINNFQVIKPEDDLYIIGDFAFKHANSNLMDIFDQIPGKKHLVIGNHDEKVTLDLPWASQDKMYEFIDGNTKVVLCHYPLMSWPNVSRGAINLFGHVHNNWAGSRNAVNVGVDLFDFKPVRIGQILDRAKTLPESTFHEVLDPTNN